MYCKERGDTIKVKKVDCGNGPLFLYVLRKATSNLTAGLWRGQRSLYIEGNTSETCD